MILRNDMFEVLAKKIKSNKFNIIVYGAGVIGQIIIPYLIEEYGLVDYLDCFVDADKRKKGSRINICGKEYLVTTPDYLETIDENNLVLVANSKFYPIINFLDGIKNLDTIEGYIVPMIQINEIEGAVSIKIDKMVETQIIPKKIHYCWFGRKEKPEFLQKCIDGWKELCPDYKIIEWNEDNYDVERHAYTAEAYKRRKYGFVTDVARLDILYEHGGIYMDTDVTLLQNLDDLLYQQGFIGTEKWGNINTGGGCGFAKGHPLLKELIDYRDMYNFVLEDGSLNVETCGMYETKLLVKHGFRPNNQLQYIENVTIYPSYINHPYDYVSCKEQRKESTVSIHHFYGGWMEEEDIHSRKNTQDNYLEILKRINGLSSCSRRE